MKSRANGSGSESNPQNLADGQLSDVKSKLQLMFFHELELTNLPFS
jgi:hypothetical protein